MLTYLRTYLINHLITHSLTHSFIFAPLGGGGWGAPLDREPDKVLDDVKDGFVSFNAAIDNYGVVINPNSLLIDLDNTTIIREQIRNDRGPTKLFHRINYFDSADEELKFIESTFPR